MQKLYEFCKKYSDTVKSFSLIITNMFISMLCLKEGYEVFGICYTVLSALWFIICILEVSLKWRENK